MNRITREHAMKRLLQHGALKRSEIVAITGWTVALVAKILGRLRLKGRVYQPIYGVWALKNV